jgi:hypothetical protein
MKTLFTFATLFITLSSLHAQFTGQFDLGYSTQSSNLKPVFAFTVGYVFNKEQHKLAPIVETGFRAHTDQQSAHNIYGHISAGLQFGNFLALTAGGIYGGNQMKQDRHVYQDTTIILTAGAKSAQYFSYQLALRGMQTVMKSDDGSPALQIIEQVTYAHSVWYAGVGIRYLLFD